MAEKVNQSNVDYLVSLLKGNQQQQQQTSSRVDYLVSLLQKQDTASKRAELQRKVREGEAETERLRKKQVGEAGWGSGLTMGVADLGLGALQGIGWLGDKVNAGINAATGSSLPTNGYEAATKYARNLNADYAQARENAGRSGFDAWRLTGNIAPTVLVPHFMGAPSVLGVSARGAPMLSRATGLAALQNAGIGAGFGAGMYADDAGQRLQNMTLGALGGAAGGVIADRLIPAVAGKAVQATVGARAAPAPSAAETARQARRQVFTALQSQGIDIRTVRKEVLRAMQAEVADALKAGKVIDPKSIARQSALKSVGIRGTRAQVSGDAAQWQAERALSKLQEVGDPLRYKYVGDHAALSGKLDEISLQTGGRQVDQVEAMTGVFDALRSNDARRQAVVRDLYDKARNMTGNDMQLNAARFVNNVTNDLESNGLGTFLKTDVRGILRGLFDGKAPLTLAKKEELVKILNARLNNTTDGSQRYALQIVRNRLEQETLDTLDDLGASMASSSIGGPGVNPGVIQPATNDAVQAWQAARAAAAQRFGVNKRTPAIQAALDDAAPDKALQRLVLGADTRDLRALVTELKGNPAAMNDLRRQVIEHIAAQSVNPNNGQFRPSAMRKVLTSLGDRRLSMLFSKDQVARLKQIDAAAHYLITEPLGANVNHSNTAAELVNHLNRATGMIPKFPGAGFVSGTLSRGVDFVKKSTDVAKVNTAMKGGVNATKPPRQVTAEELALMDRLGVTFDESGKLVRAAGMLGGGNASNR